MVATPALAAPVAPVARQFAAKSSTALPDGGRAYHYTVNGAPVTALVPPKGFDAATATPAELKLYGVPPAPPASDPAAFQAWLTMMNGSWPTAAPASLTALTVSPPKRYGGSSSYNDRSGYVAYSPAKNGIPGGVLNYFTSASTYYYQPVDQPGDPCPTQASFWTGIGDLSNFGSNGLGQAGSDMDNFNVGIGWNPNSKWFEVFPAGPIYPSEPGGAPPYATGVNWNATPGALQYVEVDYLGSGHWEFTTFDFGTDQWGTPMLPSYPPSYYNGSTVSTEAENQNTFLPDWGTWSVLAAYGNFGLYQDQPSYQRAVESGPYGAATPGAMNSQGGFGDVWKSCT